MNAMQCGCQSSLQSPLFTVLIPKRDVLNVTSRAFIVYCFKQKTTSNNWLHLQASRMVFSNFYEVVSAHIRGKWWETAEAVNTCYTYLILKWYKDYKKINVWQIYSQILTVTFLWTTVYTFTACTWWSDVIFFNSFLCKAQQLITTFSLSYIIVA